MEKRELNVAFIGNTHKSSVFAITKQTHRGTAFSVNGNTFETEGNPLRLIAGQEPQFCGKAKKVYVRGTNTDKDNNLIIVPKEWVDDFGQLILEYNLQNGGFPTETEIDRFVQEHKIRKDSNFVKYASEIEVETLEEFFDTALEDRTELAAKALKTLFKYYTPAIHCKEAYIALAKSQSWDGLKSLGNPFSE